MPTIHNETDSLHLKMPRIGGFTLLEPLSEGSCGLVYKARQDRVGRMVALKLLPEWPPATDVALERFNRAAYVNAQVCHANLLTLFDFGTVDGYHFTSMELVSGQPLQKHLAQNGPLDELFALKLAQQILGALVALHSREICHRNIKPKNIFIEVNGKARLIGLGLASCKSAFFSPHLDARPIGTPHFMAPEMIRGSFADPRSDLYSVGVTLFVATTGRTPFEKGSPMAVMSKHLTETPVSLNDARPTLSKEFCAFVDMLMARDLESRFQSAKAALDICDALVARRAPPEAGVKKESLPPILLVPRASSRGSVRKIAQKASAWMHHPAVVILSSAVVTVLMLVGLTYALKTWSNDSAKPTNAVQQSNGLSPDQREMLRLSRSDELFQRSPALGVAEWNHFLQQYPNASSASLKYARDRIDVYARLLRTPDTTQDRVRRNNLPAEQNEF